MTSAMYSQRLPPPPPPPRGGHDEGQLVPAPLTRENITLLQALSQPSRLRRRVAPNFEIVSWDDPDRMQYSLNGYRPPRSQDAAHGSDNNNNNYSTQTQPRDKYSSGAYATAGGASGAGGGRGGGGARPSAQQDGRAGREVQDAYRGSRYDEETSPQRDHRRHPERPPAPLPSNHRPQDLPSSAGSGQRLPPPRQPGDRADSYDGASTNGEREDEAYASDGDVDVGYRHDPRSGGHTGKAGRLNMQAFEDQFNRQQESGKAARGPTPREVAGETRRSDLPLREIYASRDSDDASYTKRSPHEVPSHWENTNARPANPRSAAEAETYNVDSSRPARFHETLNRDEDDFRRGSGRRAGEAGDRTGYGSRGSDEGERHSGQHGGEWEASDEEVGGHHQYSYDDNSSDDGGRAPHRSLHDNAHPRRPLRENWEKPRPDQRSNDNDTGSTNRSGKDRRDGRGEPSDVRRHGGPRSGAADDQLSGDVLSCDDYDDQLAVRSNRNHARRPQPPSRPPPPPVRGQAYPKVQPKNNKKKPSATTRHNPRAFQNKTTHSWISTNTTTTVILPAATVQLVPLSANFMPMVEEVQDEERWASPAPYRLNPPQSAGYMHRPSQMIVLDDSDDVSGRVGSSLPQLPRRAINDNGSGYPYNNAAEL